MAILWGILLLVWAGSGDRIGRLASATSTVPSGSSQLSHRIAVRRGRCGQDAMPQYVYSTQFEIAFNFFLSSLLLFYFILYYPHTARRSPSELWRCSARSALHRQHAVKRLHPIADLCCGFVTHGWQAASLAIGPLSSVLATSFTTTTTTTTALSFPLPSPRVRS